MRAIVALSLVVLLTAGCLEAEDPPSTEDQDGDGFVDAVEEKYGSDVDNATSTPPVVKTKDVDFSDSVQVVGTGVPSVQCPVDPAAANSKTVTWSITADTGKSNQTWVSGLTISLSGAQTVNDVDLFVYDPSGAQLAAATGATNEETVTIGGKRPLGDYIIEARGCSGAGDVAITGSAVVNWVPSDEELLASEA